MLALTQDAQQAIEEIVDGSEAATGIRIAPRDHSASSEELEMMVVDGPDESDQVVDSGAASLYVDAAAAPYLDDKVLDANVEGDAVRFELASRAA